MCDLFSGTEKTFSSYEATDLLLLECGRLLSQVQYLSLFSCYNSFSNVTAYQTLIKILPHCHFHYLNTDNIPVQPKHILTLTSFQLRVALGTFIQCKLKTRHV